MNMTKDKKKEIMKLAGLGLIYKINNLYNEGGFIIKNGSESQLVKLSNLRSETCDIAFMTKNISVKEIEEALDRLIEIDKLLFEIELDIRIKLEELKE